MACKGIDGRERKGSGNSLLLKGKGKWPTSNGDGREGSEERGDGKAGEDFPQSQHQYNKH